jgi:hypothetical protein
MIGSKNDMVSLYKHMHELGFRNKLIHYHCIIHEHKLIGNALGFKQIISDVISAVSFIGWRGLNHRQFQAFLDKIESEYGDRSSVA